MRLLPWEYLFKPFNAHLFPDMYTITWIATIGLLIGLVVLYNARTRALHRHAPYLDMYEWLLWTGISLFGLILVAAVFNFYFIVLLVILLGRARDAALGPLRALPAGVRGLRAEAGQAALLHPHEVRPPRGDDPAEGRRPAAAARTPSAAGRTAASAAASNRRAATAEEGAGHADRGPPVRGRPSPARTARPGRSGSPAR